MAGPPLQPSPSAGAGNDLIQTFDRQRLATTWSLQHDEDAVGVNVGWTFVAQVVAEHGEERVGDRNQALMAALAVGDEQRPIGDTYIPEA